MRAKGAGGGERSPKEEVGSCGVRRRVSHRCPRALLRLGFLGDPETLWRIPVIQFHPGFHGDPIRHVQPRPRKGTQKSMVEGHSVHRVARAHTLRLVGR
eukprot:114888-Amorphochlora_amoeboformis.AAC.1